MSFEKANAALAAFTLAHSTYKDACDTESQAQSESDLAAARLSAATASKVSADTAAEAALDELMAALADIGITLPSN